MQSVQMSPDGKFTSKALAAQKVLNDMKEGRIGSVPRSVWSNYLQSSAEFGQMAGDKAYFASPAEMFARAFEAYVDVRAADEVGGPNVFLTKGLEAYTESSDTRSAMTFPREVDAVQFSEAMSNLIQSMRIVGAFGGDAAAQIPDGSQRNFTVDLILKEQRQTLLSET